MIVELIGIPGAGKTTLAGKIVSLLSERGFVAATSTDAARRHAGRSRTVRILPLAPHPSNGRLLWVVFYALGMLNGIFFVWEHRRLVGTVVGAQLRRPVSVATKRHILFWFFQLGGRHRFLSSTGRSGEVLVVDDGFLHRSVHLSASHLEEPSRAWVRSYVDLVPPADVVVHVVAETELCERRVLERGIWRHSRNLTRDELSTYIRNANKAVSFAVERAGERGCWIGTVHNNGSSGEDLRSSLETVLQPLLAKGEIATVSGAS